MQKLIVTAACDSTYSYPSNPNNPTPKGADEVISEYQRCIDAGAAISHIHGPSILEDEVQPDGSKLSDIDIPGWGKLRDGIMGSRNTIMQYGIANARFPRREALIEAFPPDMISVAFNAHDECFDYEPGNPPVEIYGLHSRDELRQYCNATSRLGVKVEVEAFHFGGIWNAVRLHNEGILPKAVWTTLFFGWMGGTWTPPTPKAVIYSSDHCPDGFNWNASVMDPVEQWKVLATTIMMGGHVRVGMEDNPFLTPGEYASSNAELVEKIVRMARDLGREIASPDEAREIIGLPSYNKSIAKP